MAIVRKFDYAPFDDSDPDDFRPDSRWALLVDPGDDDGARVDDITLIVEEIAPGDCIPLHIHPINEVIVVNEGTPEVTLGDETLEVGPGAVVFIPAVAIAGGWLAEKSRDKFVAWGTSIGGAALVLAGLGVLVSSLAWLRDPDEGWQAVVGAAAWIALSVVFRFTQKAVGSNE